MFTKLFSSRRKPQASRKPLRPRLEVLETRLAPAVVRWITNGDGNWQDCGSWRVDGTNPPVFRCPGAGDDAIIDVGVLARITYSAATGTQQVRSLVSNEILDMTGGNLTVGEVSRMQELRLAAGAVLNAVDNTQLTITLARDVFAGTLNLGAGGTLNLAEFVISGRINAAATSTVNMSSCGNMFLEVGDAFSGAGEYTLLGNVFCGPQLRLNTAVTVENFTLSSNGGIVGNGEFTVTDEFTWKSGTVGGTGTVTIPAGADLFIEEHHAKTLDRRELRNSGTATWRTDRASLGFANTGNFNNLAAGTINVQNDTTMVYGTGILTNAGTLNKSLLQKPGLSTISMRFTNTGTVNVQSGILRTEGVTDTSGTIQVNAGAEFLMFYGNNVGPFTIDPGAAFTGAGTFHLDGNGNARIVLNTNLTIPNFLMDESVIIGAGSLTVGQQMTWNGGLIGGTGTLIVPAGRTLALNGMTGKALADARVLNNAGTMTWDGSGRFGIAQDARFNNSGSFTILNDARLDSYLYDFSPPGVVTNTGTWTKTSAGATIINVIFNTSAPVAVNAGELRLQRGGTSTAPFNLGAGANLAITGGTYIFEAGTTVNGGTGLAINGGTLQLNTDLSVAQATLTGNGTLTGPATFTVTGELTWARGTMTGAGTTIIPAGATLTMSGNDARSLAETRIVNLEGTGFWRDGGDITLNAAGTSLNVGGTLTVQNDRILSGAGRLVITGTLTKTSAGLTNVFSIFQNHGTANIAAGELRLNSAGVSSGAYDVGAAGQLTFAGNTHQLEAGASFTGAGATVLGGATVDVQGSVSALNLNLQAGILTGVGTLTITGGLDWSGGQMQGATGTTRIEVGAFLFINGSNVKTLNARTLELDGLLLWLDSGAISVFGGTVDVQANGIVLFIHDSDQTMGGSGFLNNAGIILKLGPAQTNLTGTFTLNDNGGYVAVLEGGLSVGGRYIQNSGITEVYGALRATGGVELRGGEMVLNGGQITGNVSLTNVNATLSGSGAISGNLVNGGRINVGGVGVAGLLTVGGEFTQEALGVLNMELGGTAAGQYDRLSVVGRATLGGTLNVALIDGFMATLGDSFRMLEATGGRNNSQFAAITGLNLGANQLDPQYDATGLTLMTI